ncbi:hypothetical protein [Olivibacter sp. XZL3]|uniref:hypothetical protein n=1 Tax=Olivibacter sp. XZL3 TaxID=1735116 RepID=UPI00197F6B09|nr:hypothetical protein [Olivibacter sp. XZL3]
MGCHSVNIYNSSSNIRGRILFRNYFGASGKNTGLETSAQVLCLVLEKKILPICIKGDFDTRLQQIINLTLESDIPLFADMNVAMERKMKQFLGS